MELERQSFTSGERRLDPAAFDKAISVHGGHHRHNNGEDAFVQHRYRIWDSASDATSEWAKWTATKLKHAR